MSAVRAPLPADISRKPMDGQGVDAAKSAMFSKLHQGKKWFDSGEYFMSKEGKAPADLLPGGAPVDSLPPKLSVEPPAPKQPTNLSQAPKEQRGQTQPSHVSEY